MADGNPAPPADTAFHPEGRRAGRGDIIAGERVYLSALDKAHIPTALAWLADPDVNAFLLAGHEPISVEQEEQWYDDMAASETDQVFEIHVAANGRYIGNTGLRHIDVVHRNAELGIMIGSVPDQGQGFGRDAVVALLRHAFETLGLHRIFLRCQPANERALRTYRAVGFVEVGRERETAFIDGRFQDHLVFDMLEDEFRARYG